MRFSVGQKLFLVLPKTLNLLHPLILIFCPKLIDPEMAPKTLCSKLRVLSYLNCTKAIKFLYYC